jgi:hypothetical protein
LGKHKIFGESVEVALHGLDEGAGLDLVQLGQVSIKHYFLAADDVDSPLDEFEGYRQEVLGGRDLAFVE